MKITILGPWGAYPEVNSSTSSILVEQDHFNLLIDCGSGVLSQLQRYIPIYQLHGLVISHYHKDHIADVGCLQYATMVQQQLGNRSDFLPIFGHNKDLNHFDSLTYKEYTKGYEINDTNTLNIGPLTVTFSPTVHPVYGLAMRFESKGKSFVYTGDTEWTDSLIEFSMDTDLLISEASLYNEYLGKIEGHLTAGQAGELAAKSRARRLIITHLPHFGNHQLLLKEVKEAYKGEVFLAKAGLNIEL